MKELAEHHALNTGHRVLASITAADGIVRMVWSCCECDARGDDLFDDYHDEDADEVVAP